ncbi:Penicillin-binding protein [Chitinophaga sp. 180180018-2]|uniref:hypothetical protein n=1 Tax=uncultured Dysgonomonas sp. TaxID=206096 RepID=UPI001AD191B5|nr:hypothetical protein [uncultured Dysgonomonas sp.]MBN9484349.1 hypothetical protein [Bacteroidota bacterium]MEC5143566.1 Penicillin-binding protein [Chitinophaga sp. 212800010-3]
MRKNKKANNKKPVAPIYSINRKLTPKRRPKKKWYAVLRIIFIIIVSAILILAIIAQVRHYYLHVSGEGHKKSVEKQK